MKNIFSKQYLIFKSEDGRCIIATIEFLGVSVFCEVNTSFQHTKSKFRIELSNKEDALELLHSINASTPTNILSFEMSDLPNDKCEVLYSTECFFGKHMTYRDLFQNNFLVLDYNETEGADRYSLELLFEIER